MKKLLLSAAAGFLFSGMIMTAPFLKLSYAQSQTDEREKLATETEAYCKSTAKEQPTKPGTVIEKVDEACKLIEQEGPAAFPKFKGNGSPFIFEGTYIWIHTLNGAIMLMHPIKYKMEGNQYVDLQDKSGKRFFAIMNDLVKEKGAGWVDYLWPVPGSKEIQRKISYVKLCKMPDGTTVVLGCGMYKYSEEDIAKLEVR